MGPLVASLLLLQVALADGCASEKFTEAGACCSLCPAGSGVEVGCGQQDTQCRPCPPGTFSESEGLGPCLPCSQCSRAAPQVAACTPTSDTQCACQAGRFYMAQYGLCAPCSQCKRGQGAVRQCGPGGDVRCVTCASGTFMEDQRHSKACQTCTRCSDSEVEIRACMPNSDTLCMDKKIHILSRPPDGSRDTAWPEESTENPATGTPKLTPQDDGGSNNILVYVSVLAAVVLGLLVYVAYKCWRSCKQKKALSKARAAELGAELGAALEGEKLQSDSGVFLDTHSSPDAQLNKGTRRDSKLDSRLYVNLPPGRQQEVEALLQGDGGRGWRQLGVALGYEPEQLDLFGRGEAPARTLLSNWAQKEGATLGLLCSALARVERPDVVTALYGPAQGAVVV